MGFAGAGGQHRQIRWDSTRSLRRVQPKEGKAAMKEMESYRRYG